jgi:transcriptional regulator with XRE-family HTH domain
MFTNRVGTGNTARNNLVGLTIRDRRLKLRISQRELADRLTVIGLDVDKNAVQRMEDGKRFITDIEMTYLANLFCTSVEALISESESILNTK